MAAKAGLSLTWSETPKTGFLVIRLIFLKDAIGMANSGELDQTVPYESTLFALTYRSEKYYSNLKIMFRKVFHRTGSHIYYQFV